MDSSQNIRGLKHPKEILDEWLKKNGYSGLTLDGCYCLIGNLIQCPIDAYCFFECLPFSIKQDGILDKELHAYKGGKS
jgi:hypothetical protein